MRYLAMGLMAHSEPSSPCISCWSPETPSWGSSWLAGSQWVLSRFGITSREVGE